VGHAIPAAAGLALKGWSAARRLALDADTARLRATAPEASVSEFLALVALARRLAPANLGSDEHLAALVAVAAAFRRAGRP
jgi:hypothetical protein